MFSVKALVAGAIGFLLGNAIGGTFVGALFAAVLITSLYFKTRVKPSNLSAVNVESLRAAMPEKNAERLQQLNERYGDLKPPPQLQRLFFVWFGVVALPFFYDIVLALLHNTRILNAWLQIFQPAVEWLGLYMPAIKRVPAALNAMGYPTWAPVVQHALFVSWFTAGPMLVWMMLDIWFFHRNMWTNSTTGPSKDFALASIASFVIFVIVLAMLFFGSVPPSLLESFAGIGLLGKTFMFLFLAFLAYAFALSSASLVRLISKRHAARQEANEERKSRSERMAVLRSVFRRRSQSMDA